MRVHAHGSGRLQRRACAGRFGRAPLHGHHRRQLSGSSDQDLAWTLVTARPIERVRELENELGCFFDRNPDGSVHQKAFAGQTFDRTVHKGDLTGIEIINRLAEQVWARDIGRLEDHRAARPDPHRRRRVRWPACCWSTCSRRRVRVRAAPSAVLLGTGGGPTMYKLPHALRRQEPATASRWRCAAGLPLRDMEMVQFHPTGLLAGPHTRMTGTVLEEGLRGAGGYLLNGAGERFMQRYDPRGERATRDIVSRCGIRRNAGRAHHAQRRCVPGRCRISAPINVRQPVQGHGRALRLTAASTLRAARSRWCRPRTT